VVDLLSGGIAEAVLESYENGMARLETCAHDFLVGVVDQVIHQVDLGQVGVARHIEVACRNMGGKLIRDLKDSRDSG